MKSVRNPVAESQDVVTYYLLRGIQEGEMNHAAELAQCLGLEVSLIERLLDYLTESGLVGGKDGAIMLTEPGRAVLRDHVTNR